MRASTACDARNAACSPELLAASDDGGVAAELGAPGGPPAGVIGLAFAGATSWTSSAAPASSPTLQGSGPYIYCTMDKP